MPSTADDHQRSLSSGPALSGLLGTLDEECRRKQPGSEEDSDQWKELVDRPTSRTRTYEPRICGPGMSPAQAMGGVESKLTMATDFRIWVRKVEKRNIGQLNISQSDQIETIVNGMGDDVRQLYYRYRDSSPNLKQRTNYEQFKDGLEDLLMPTVSKIAEDILPLIAKKLEGGPGENVMAAWNEIKNVIINSKKCRTTKESFPRLVLAHRLPPQVTKYLLTHLQLDLGCFLDDAQECLDNIAKEIATARANAAQTSVAQISPESAASSWFSEATNQVNQSVGFSTPSTESSDETLRKTVEISNVSVSEDNTGVPQSRGQTGATMPNLNLSLDKADGSNATSAPVVAQADREVASDMSNIRDVPTLNLQSVMMSIRGDPSIKEVCTLTFYVFLIESELNICFFYSTFHIKVRRGNVLKELMKIFRENNMLNSILQCEVQAGFTEEAIGSGVLLDMLSAFWEEFFQHYSEGEDEKVLVCTENNQENLKCAGSILRFGFEYCPKNEPLHFFPHQLCLASIINFIHHNCISDNMADKEAIWTASLYAYLGAISGEKIRAVYENPNAASEDDWEEINDMLDDLFQKKYKVDADNIRDKLSHLADVHLLQKSKTFLDLMGLFNWKKWYPQHFGNIDKIVEFSKRFHPTPVDVVNALKEDIKITNPIEEEALKNLRKFTRGLTQVDLRKFLRFVTGSALKPKTILVNFSRNEHQPINARTCSSLLYIPLGLKYNDFRNTFKEIISSEMYQDMTYALSH
ncbi:hypothetical protein CAPTEDRAFT_211773 [Capitella teleta]|uniref:HECT domain-containing protein n=1 Tax=Capitella teleta TaxID=283909 RepID=R7T484_CAPTE|nr:hypothetical protein CAPTEDRAFT_211773 [Capitella teleta]|eukprot:ELT87752.1 hypothetical protein CAPTEDRAFT_211773 [Capitella teleta]